VLTAATTMRVGAPADRRTNLRPCHSSPESLTPRCNICKKPVQCEPFLFRSITTVRLCDLPKGASAVVERVEDVQANDPIAQRLRDLGFVEGERVKLVAQGPVGADPLLVQIGYTRFALRRSEAARVTVQEVA
jgi:ferrous iron transport protein A